MSKHIRASLRPSSLVWKAKSEYNLDLYSSVQRARFFFVTSPLLVAFSAVSMAFRNEWNFRERFQGSLDEKKKKNTPEFSEIPITKEFHTGSRKSRKQW